MSATTPTPPTALTVKPGGIPARLRAYPQWVLWRYHLSGDKWTKVLYNARTNQKARTNDSTTWATFGDTLRAYEGGTWDGIGFVLTADDPFCFIDLDKCYDPQTKMATDDAKSWIDTLDSWTEFSPSNTGFHIIVEATAPPEGHKRGGVEIYDRLRFFTVTGRRVAGTPAETAMRQEQTNAFHRHYWPDHWGETGYVGPQKDVTAGKAPPHHDHSETISGDERGANDLHDDEILRLARAAANGGKFASLYDDGDTGENNGDDSAADLALCAMLTFYAGRGGEEQVDRLFRRSALYRPEKWGRREDYRRRTLAKAFEREDYYTPYGGYNTMAQRAGLITDMEWPQPTPIETAALPSWPSKVFPPTIEAMVNAVAEATQTPRDGVGLMALANIAIAVQRKAEVQPQEGWREPLNLYVAPLMGSGERKSAVVAAMSRPLDDWESAERTRRAPELAAYQTERDILEGRLRKAKKNAADLAKPEERRAAQEEASRLAQELLAMPERFPLQLLADDATPESLKTIIYEQGGRAGIVSAEATVFEQMGGRYSANGGPNAEVYLQAHAGDTLRVNRRARNELIYDPALTIAVFAQPDVLRSLAKHPELRQRGAVARFAFALPTSIVSKRNLTPPPVPAAVQHNYATMFMQLLALPYPEGRSDTFPTIIFDAYAARVFLAFRSTIEADLASFERLGELRDWGNKLPGLVARIAGLLHIVKHAGSAAPWDEPIDQATMKAAIALGEYLIPHALAAADQMGLDGSLADARYLAEWLSRQSDALLTEQAIWQATKKRFLVAERLREAITQVVQRDYLRELPQVARAGGGKVARSYARNPHLCPNPPISPKSPGTVAQLGEIGGLGQGNENQANSPDDEEVGRL